MDREWTRTDAARRWIVVAGLVVGPVLAALSVVVGIRLGGADMRAQFTSMGAHAGTVLAQDVLETAGFVLVLAALAGATGALRVRGGTLGTVGAALSVVGITGFAASNATGLAVVALAQQPDQDAAFRTAMAMSSQGVLATAGTLGFALEIVAQVGMLLVFAGLVRARLASVWVLPIVVVGVAVNAVVGTMAATLVADLLLVAVCVWTALRVARCSRAQWLGQVVPAPHARRVAVPDIA
ncbi:hypothetical protein PU630_07395 [Microbacterium horticulturae]|uniref:DUF4386 family protein n=1 Tax=Microbacterium horticulturae TaxID=3028316 RepID=A0ABY8C1N8_9MICO|nr:hypothetical protein [Microbacterium sp. KACC 23027]WEG10364.1 hypothetical protein PU630_07395 [Microbacterium sp. KACC 23027]